MSNVSNRLLAIKVLVSILSENGSLSSLLTTVSTNNPDANLALIREYTYGVCRWYQRLNFMACRLLKKPLRKKDCDVHCLILLGLYQLFHMRTPDHAAINETVALTHRLKKDWARPLVNAVLRQAQRDGQSLESAIAADETARLSHPPWLAILLQQDWPDCFEEIAEQNNRRAPMTLRVNLPQVSRSIYLEQLQDADIPCVAGGGSETAIILENPVDVSLLPGFQDGLVSVQDEASQLVAALLNPAKNMKVLDACAAPGGKTCALLEYCNGELELVALDNSEERLLRVRENLERLKLNASIVCADAADIDSWWDGLEFDAVLLDAPCSGTGVIRRHPDIKLLRQADDIARLVQLQSELLAALWSTVKKGGKLLYSTCSVLRDENEKQIAAFVTATNDVKVIPVSHPQALNCSFGMQFLPGRENLDGFYYALLEKY